MLSSKCSFSVLFFLAAHNGAQAVNAMHVTRLPFSNDLENSSSMVQMLVPDDHNAAEPQVLYKALQDNVSKVYKCISDAIDDRKIRGCSKIGKK